MENNIRNMVLETMEDFYRTGTIEAKDLQEVRAMVIEEIDE